MPAEFSVPWEYLFPSVIQTVERRTCHVFLEGPFDCAFDADGFLCHEEWNSGVFGLPCNDQTRELQTWAVQFHVYCLTLLSNNLLRQGRWVFLFLFSPRWEWNSETLNGLPKVSQPLKMCLHLQAPGLWAPGPSYYTKLLPVMEWCGTTTNDACSRKVVSTKLAKNQRSGCRQT